jgi:hypothetical protein
MTIFQPEPESETNGDPEWQQRVQDARVIVKTKERFLDDATEARKAAKEEYEAAVRELLEIIDEKAQPPLPFGEPKIVVVDGDTGEVIGKNKEVHSPDVAVAAAV